MGLVQSHGEHPKKQHTLPWSASVFCLSAYLSVTYKFFSETVASIGTKFSGNGKTFTQTMKSGHILKTMATEKSDKKNHEAVTIPCVGWEIPPFLA